ncbi:hypothetical protein ACJRO7_007306 [Eucalyptus globulus]|uniref:Uncharacterized protein n=1 Tax=Eucalyptus globulus TaxID=34317 RepID=A0ABD3IN99_EUCGL
MDRLIGLEPSNVVAGGVDFGAAADAAGKDGGVGDLHVRRGPLVSAGGHMEVLRLLLLKGADLDSPARDGSTVLHLMVEERRRDCVRLLLANGARTDQVVKLLLLKGAKKDVWSRYGKTTYDVAMEHGHARLFGGLKLGERLCAAARKGDVRAINRLPESGAAGNGRDQHGWTARHRAAFKGQADAVQTLLDKGVDVDVDARDEDGYTALNCTAESRQFDVVELLVKRGPTWRQGRTRA